MKPCCSDAGPSGGYPSDAHPGYMSWEWKQKECRLLDLLGELEHHWQWGDTWPRFVLAGEEGEILTYFLGVKPCYR